MYQTTEQADIHAARVNEAITQADGRIFIAEVKKRRSNKVVALRFNSNSMAGLNLGRLFYFNNVDRVLVDMYDDNDESDLIPILASEIHRVWINGEEFDLGLPV